MTTYCFSKNLRLRPIFTLQGFKLTPRSVEIISLMSTATVLVDGRFDTS